MKFRWTRPKVDQDGILTGLSNLQITADRLHTKVTHLEQTASHGEYKYWLRHVNAELSKILDCLSKAMER